MRLALVLGAIWETKAWTSLTDQLAKTRTAVACENDEIQLACLGSDVLQIKKVFYGREDTTRCAAHPDFMKNVQCKSYPFQNVNKKCKNQATCRFNVDDDFLDDPCPGTRKYISIKYECVKFVFGHTEPYFDITERQEIQVKSTSGQIWSTDPIRSTRNYYQLLISKAQISVLNIYNRLEDAGLGHRLNLPDNEPLDSIELDIPAEDTNFVVWDENMFYVATGDKPKLIKVPISGQAQVASVLLSQITDYATGLFGPNFVLLASESGIFGCFKANNVWNLVKIDQQLHFEKFYKTNIVAQANDRVLLIGLVLYVMRGRSFQEAVNIQSGQSYQLSGLPQLRDELEFLSYSPRYNQLILSSRHRVVRLQLEFKAKLPTPSKLVSTTTSTSLLSSLSPTPAPNISDATCPEITLNGINWPQALPNQVTHETCNTGVGFAMRKCDEAGRWEEPDVTDCLLVDLPRSIQEGFKQRNLPAIIGQLEVEVGKTGTDAARVKLIENVSRHLINIVRPDQRNEISEPLLSLLDELHCWYLVESESFLWLMAQSDSLLSTNQSEVPVRPRRCSQNTIYVFYQSSSQPKTVSSRSICYYFTSGIYGDEMGQSESTNWEACRTCTQCPPSLFFKIENDDGAVLSMLNISIAISISMMFLMTAILIIIRERELPYPPLLRFLLLSNQMVLFSCILLPFPFVRDVLLTLTAMFQFEIVLCISHCLYQRSKPVSHDVDINLRWYMFLIVVSSAIIVVITCAIFLVRKNDVSVGWLSLNITWSASLLTPVLVTTLFASIWLIQSATLSSHLRPLAVKFSIYLLCLTLTLTVMLLSLLSFTSIEWLLAIFIIVTSFSSFICLAPHCSLSEAANAKNQNSRQNWLQIDNRSSLADFRYIPVVHNIHSANYAKPRSIDRLYTEIIPDQNDIIENGSQFNPQMQRTIPNQITGNSSTADWGHCKQPSVTDDSYRSKRSGAYREDSGVHTAHDSSDSCSDRHSPTVTEEKQAFLGQDSQARPAAKRPSPVMEQPNIQV